MPRDKTSVIVIFTRFIINIGALSFENGMIKVKQALAYLS